MAPSRLPTIVPSSPIVPYFLDVPDAVSDDLFLSKIDQITV